jgi:hypothetical protein
MDYGHKRYFPERYRFGAGLEAGAVAVAGNSLSPAKQHERDCLLRMHAVLGLIEDDRLRPVEYGVRDFRAAVRGKAVHEDGGFLRARHQRHHSPERA